MDRALAAQAKGTFTNLVSTGDLTVNGHIISSSTSHPTVTDDVGFTVFVSATSTDAAGQITIPLADIGASTVTLTFTGTGYPAGSTPQCFITPANAEATVDYQLGYNVTSTTTTMVITFTAPTSGQDLTAGDVFDYYVIANK